MVVLKLTMLDGRQVAGPEITWWRVGDEQSGLRGCSGGGTWAVALKLMWLGGKQAARNEGAWWMWEMSNQPQKDLVPVKDGRQAVRPERMWLGQR